MRVSKSSLHRKEFMEVRWSTEDVRDAIDNDDAQESAYHTTDPLDLLMAAETLFAVDDQTTLDFWTALTRG